MQNPSRALLHGGAGVGFAEAVNQFLIFVRNIIVARFVSTDDFGIAAVFATTLSIFEMTSNFSLEKKLIQTKGNVDQTQSSSQLIELLRSIVGALLVFILAHPIAVLFGIPDTDWGFRLLALALFARGFIHLDMFRAQRDMRFRPSITVNILSGCITTAAAVPLAFLLRDYSVMLYVIIIRSASNTILSHLVKERPYSLKGDRAVMHDVWSYGWPLLINGGLLFVILQGDRFIIGIGSTLFSRCPYTVADVGFFAIASGFALIPTALVAKVSTSVFMPFFAKVQGIRSELYKRYSLCLGAISWVAISMAVMFSTLGGWAITFTYGSKYEAACRLIGWLGVAQAFRIIRVVPTSVLLATGKTRSVMINNIIRAVGFLVTCIVAYTGGPLVYIAISAAFGELLTLIACGFQVKFQAGFKLIDLYIFTILTVIISMFGLTLDSYFLDQGLNIARFVSFLLLFFSGTFFLIWYMPGLREKAASYGLDSISRIRGRISI